MLLCSYSTSASFIQAVSRSPLHRVPSRWQKGEIVIIRRTSVGEGWYEAERNGSRGLVPMKFVRKVCVRLSTLYDSSLTMIEFVPSSVLAAALTTAIEAASSVGPCSHRPSVHPCAVVRACECVCACRFELCPFAPSTRLQCA